MRTETSAQNRSLTPPRSAVAPIRILKICFNDTVLGGVEVNEGTSLADVRSSIAEDEIPGVPEDYSFLFGGAPVSLRQEGRRWAMDCFPFLTLIPASVRVLPNYVISGMDGQDMITAIPSGQPGAHEREPSRDAPQAHDIVAHTDDNYNVVPPPPAAAVSDSTLELQITDGPLDGTSVTVGEAGARIGRHTSNTLVVPEERISRFHFEIARPGSEFCIRDLGSTTGTFFFLRPHIQFQMYIGLMVKLGETEFQVINQSPPDQPEQVQEVQFYAGPLVGQKVYIPGTGISIGRRHNNSLVLVQDGTVSAHHATIHCEDGEFFLTDLGSCNGTCVRLSAEREESDWHPILDGDLLGAGCTKIRCTLRS